MVGKQTKKKTVHQLQKSKLTCGSPFQFCEHLPCYKNKNIELERVPTESFQNSRQISDVVLPWMIFFEAPSCVEVRFRKVLNIWRYMVFRVRFLRARILVIREKKWIHEKGHSFAGKPPNIICTKMFHVSGTRQGCGKNNPLAFRVILWRCARDKHGRPVQSNGKKTQRVLFPVAAI